MFVTFIVLNRLKSIVSNFSQAANIELISVTSLVFKYSIPVMETRFSIQ